MARHPRPVFLNLLQIKMPVGAWTSIGHRITGVLLALGIPASIYVLDLSLRSEAGFAHVKAVLEPLAVKGVVVLLVWALAHHLLAGVRHLLTDVGVGSTLGAARRSGWLVNLGALALALLAAGVLL